MDSANKRKKHTSQLSRVQRRAISLYKAEQGLTKIIDPVTRISDIIGRIVLVFMMLLVTGDVVLRYFFNRPIKGSYELIEFMLVTLVALGLGYTQSLKEHISITLLKSRWSSAQVSVIENITHLFCLGIFSLITWRSAVEAEILRVSGTSSGVLFIPNYLFMWLVVFGSALLCLVFFRDFTQALECVIQRCKHPWLWISLNFLIVFTVFTVPWWLEWLPWEINRPDMGVIGIGFLVVLLFSSMLIGPVMALVGFIGFAYLVNPDAALSILGTSPYRSISNHTLSTIPLFILMGFFCFHSDLSKDVFNTFRVWLGRFRGGMAMATIGGCAGFAAVSGSSMASTATMGTLAIPEMRRYKYDDSLATGCIAAGSSIGILIPPSIPFIIYAALTETSIGKLFIAGIIPGLLEALFYIITIMLLCKYRPELGPKGPSSTFKEKIISLKGTWGILTLFIIVIGGIYTGICTPTEAAGIGAFGAFVLGMIKRKFNFEKILLSFSSACRNTALLLLLIIGSDIFGYFLTMSQIPFLLAESVVALQVPNWVTLWMILLVYVILGCILPIMGLIVLTVPIFFPIVTGLGYDPIWFGVLMVTVAEIGQITPPVGINVFVLSGVAKDVPLGTIFKGIVPFLISDIVRIVIIFLFPGFILWLPSLMS